MDNVYVNRVDHLDHLVLIVCTITWALTLEMVLLIPYSTHEELSNNPQIYPVTTGIYYELYCYIVLFSDFIQMNNYLDIDLC